MAWLHLINRHSIKSEHLMPKAKAGERRTPPSLRPVNAPRMSGARATMFRDVVMLLYTTTGRLQRLKRLVASTVKLNSTEYSIVAALYRLGPKAGIRVRDIANYLHMAPENVTTAGSPCEQETFNRAPHASSSMPHTPPLRSPGPAQAHGWLLNPHLSPD